MVDIPTQPMKNKKMLYILIPGTLIVWGLIIFKIINNMHPDADPVLRQNIAITQQDETVSDTFSINPIYRDPFLGKMIQPRSSESGDPVVKRQTVPVVAVVKAPTPWPAIVYTGTIKNQKSNKEMVLLEINGEGHMMKVGETITGVFLFKAFRDSVEVQFSKEKKIIHK